MSYQELINRANRMAVDGKIGTKPSPAEIMLRGVGGLLQKDIEETERLILEGCADCGASVLDNGVPAEGAVIQVTGDTGMLATTKKVLCGKCAGPYGPSPLTWTVPSGQDIKADIKKSIERIKLQAGYLQLPDEPPQCVGRMMEEEEYRQHRINERRLKRYMVDPSCLLDFLRSMEHWPEYLTKAIIPGLPEGATLEDVRYDELRRCLSVTVHHPSFEPCPDGAEIAIADGYHMVEKVVLRRQEDGSYRPLGSVAEMVADFYSKKIQADIVKSGELASGTSDAQIRPETMSADSREWFAEQMRRTD